MSTQFARRCLILGCTIAAIISITVSWRWQQFTTTPLLTGKEDNPVLVTVKPGMSAAELARYLLQSKRISSSHFFIILTRIKRLSHSLKAGTYQITAQDTPVSLLTKIADGAVMQASLTLVDGWTLHRVLEQLNKTVQLKHTIKTVEQIPALLSVDHDNVEGLLYPDTYSYQYGDSDSDIIRRAHRKLRQVLKRVWQDRAYDLPYTKPYELLIAASVIEKETGRDNERTLVSSVIVNRLKRGMRLQMDPTVIYGLGDRYRGTLSRDDLRRDTPYNTYRRRGLPPTPIALVGLKSLVAAAHPRQSNYLYFVAKGDGSHHFSTNLSDQRRAIQRYIKPAQVVSVRE